MAKRETDYYAAFDGERAMNLFRVRWVENRDLIRTIGGLGGGNFDVWKVGVEDAEKVAKCFGVSLTALTEAGYIGEAKEGEDAR